MSNNNDYKKIAELIYPNIKLTPEDYYKKYPKRKLKEGAEVTRFAPSPTGFMHIGGVYQALINKKMADDTGGIFCLRNEDTDTKRELAGSADIIYPSLDGFGLVPDEGFISSTEEKGKYGPYRQSQRKEIYQTFAKYLIQKGRAYPCFCEGRESEEARKEQEKLGVPTGYYGKWAKCRDLTYEQVKEKIDAGKSFTIRIKSDGDGVKRFKFSDLRLGDTLLPVNYNDYILIKSDGLALYHMGHLVDDTLMHTTTVVRGEDWFPSVPLHVQLFEYLGVPAPKYLHTSLINTTDLVTGTIRKVSKRKDAWADSRWFHEKGYPKEAVVEYLLNIINSSFEPWREKNPEAGVSEFKFSPDKMSKSGALFDISKINSISKEVISRMTAEEVYDRVLVWATKYSPGFAKILKKNKEHSINIFNMDRQTLRPRKDITIWSEVEQTYTYMWDELYNSGSKAFDFDEKISHKDIKAVLEDYIQRYNEHDNQEEWFARMKETAAVTGFAPETKLFKADPLRYKGSLADVSTIIRVAVTGRKQTPDLYSILRVLGVLRTHARLKEALDFISHE